MKFYENARKLTFPPLIIAPPLHTKATVLCEAKELISAHVAVRKTSRVINDEQFCGARQRGHPVRKQTHLTPPPLRGCKLCSSFATIWEFPPCRHVGNSFMGFVPAAHNSKLKLLCDENRRGVILFNI